MADTEFNPMGLKVLVVDDDAMCLRVVSAMLKRCRYEVSTKSNGREALEDLKAKQGTPDQYDLVLSDVYMPDMDGFKLLESVGLELEMPVIMMSSDGDANVVLRGVTHGAVDFLIMPLRIEELRNVWQHVIRRRSTQLSAEGGTDHESEAQMSNKSGKRKENEVVRAEHEGGGGGKKPRVVWSVEMHQQFVSAVNKLGIDKAVPKRILDLMKVEGLTRENVASHLQKYRLYLKRVENVAGGMEQPNASKARAGSSFGAVMSGVHEANMDVGKPPLQKGKKNSKSSTSMDGMEGSPDASAHAPGMHGSSSTPNLHSSSTPWMPGYQPAYGYQGHQGHQGAYHPMYDVLPVYGAPPQGAFGWHNNGLVGPPPAAYGAATSSMFYQPTGTAGFALNGAPGYPPGQAGLPATRWVSLPGNPLGNPQSGHPLAHGNLPQQTADACSTDVRTASPCFPENGNMSAMPQASDFDSMTAQGLNSSGDNSPNKAEKVDLVSEFIRTGSSSAPDTLPNFGIGSSAGKLDDHDSDVLNMFINNDHGR